MLRNCQHIRGDVEKNAPILQSSFVSFIPQPSKKQKYQKDGENNLT
jgi:hypothetical protein